MKAVSLLLFLVVGVACGKKSGEVAPAVSEKRGLCSFNNTSVACESIQGTDGQGVDLLDAMIDVPVKIENSEITFLADKSATSSGRRITCSVGVKKGESYRFALRGDKLLLMTADGSFEMSKLSDGDGLQGSWSWKGYVDQGTHLLLNMTILGSGRIILRTNCEL